MVPTKVIKSDKSSVYSIKFIHCVSFKVFIDYIESFFWPQLNSKLKFVCIVHHIVSHSSTIFSVVAASLLRLCKFAVLCEILWPTGIYGLDFYLFFLVIDPNIGSCWKKFLSLEGKQYSNNFQEHDCLWYLKVPHFSSLLRSTRERSGKFKSRKKSCSWKFF